MEVAGNLVDHVAQLRTGKPVEDEDFVDPVQELWPERLLQRVEDTGPHLLVPRVIGPGPRCPEAERAGMQADSGCADIAGHDDDRVAEIHGPPVPVSQSPVIEDLEERIEDFRVRLLNLVKQDDLIGTAPDCLGELATLVKAHIARR